jgi:hypothetical protein
MDENKNLLNKFSDSGRFISRNDFLEKYPLSVLEDNCTDVIVYHNFDQNIQVLNTGEFYYDDNIRGFILDDLELKLFTKKIVNN